MRGLVAVESGTCDAAQDLAHEYTIFFLTLGVQVERATPCRVHLTFHGADFTVVASAKQIAWLG